MEGGGWRGDGGLLVVALMQVSVEDPDVPVGPAAVIQVVPVVVVVAAAAA